MCWLVGLTGHRKYSAWPCRSDYCRGGTFLARPQCNKDRSRRAGGSSGRRPRSRPDRDGWPPGCRVRTTWCAARASTRPPPTSTSTTRRCGAAFFFYAGFLLFNLRSAHVFFNESTAVKKKTNKQKASESRNRESREIMHEIRLKNGKKI